MIWTLCLNSWNIGISAISSVLVNVVTLWGVVQDCCENILDRFWSYKGTRLHSVSRGQVRSSDGSTNIYPRILHSYNFHIWTFWALKRSEKCKKVNITILYLCKLTIATGRNTHWKLIRPNINIVYNVYIQCLIYNVWYIQIQCIKLGQT